MTASASASPSAAARVTCSPRTASGRRRPARRRGRTGRPRPPRGPGSRARCPTRTAPSSPGARTGTAVRSGSTTMWPASPANPWAPRTSSPSATSPPPMPVPERDQHGVVARRGPRRRRARPTSAQVASLSTRTGSPSRRVELVADAHVAQPGQVGPEPQDALRGRPGRRCRRRRRRRSRSGRPACRTTSAMASSSGAVAVGRGHPRLGDHRRGVVGVERDAEHLGAADVDAGDEAAGGAQ